MSEEQEKPWTSEGKCSFCNQTFSQRGIGRHLKTCKARKAAYEVEASGGRTKPKKLFHLQVEGRYMPYYWMHIEMPADATLQDLDYFLRDIWLECCGHLSAFNIKGQEYFVDPVTARELGGRSMNAKLSAALEPGMQFYHEYDFGTTTELVLKVVAEREGIAKGKTIPIMARNDPPSIMCEGCGKELATQVCAQCIYYDEAWFCDECAPEHECGEEMFLPVVNSPRVGMCGYRG